MSNKKNEENNVVKFDDVVEEMVQESAEKNGLNKVEEKKEGLVVKVKNNKKKILVGAGIMVGVGLVAYGIYKIVTSDGVVEVPQAEYDPEMDNVDVPFVEETTGA